MDLVVYSFPIPICRTSRQVRVLEKEKRKNKRTLKRSTYWKGVIQRRGNRRCTLPNDSCSGEKNPICFGRKSLSSLPKRIDPISRARQHFRAPRTPTFILHAPIIYAGMIEVYSIGYNTNNGSLPVEQVINFPRLPYNSAINGPACNLSRAVKRSSGADLRFQLSLQLGNIDLRIQ